MNTVVCICVFVLILHVVFPNNSEDGVTLLKGLLSLSALGVCPGKPIRAETSPAEIEEVPFALLSIQAHVLGALREKQKEDVR